MCTQAVIQGADKKNNGCGMFKVKSMGSVEKTKASVIKLVKMVFNLDI